MCLITASCLYAAENILFAGAGFGLGCVVGHKAAQRTLQRWFAQEIESVFARGRTAGYQQAQLAGYRALEPPPRLTRYQVENGRIEIVIDGKQ